jgi:four helix bundle protein
VCRPERSAGTQIRQVDLDRGRFHAEILALVDGRPLAPRRRMDLQPIQPRLAVFARDIRLFAAHLLDRLDARDAALQVIRAASGAAANHRSAQRGRSYAEFRSKLDVALEEADEAQFWLEHIEACELCTAERLAPLRREAENSSRS